MLDVRPSRRDYGAYPHGMPFLEDNLARVPIMDSNYGRNIVVEVDLAEWWVLVQ
jgi:hypothetical protein